jgi:ABC-type phosphate transport system auxiliary subunit
MWSETKQQELDELRRHEEQRTLTPLEVQRLDDLLREIEQEELVALHPGIERIRNEQHQLEMALDDAQRHNSDLAAIAVRYAALLDRARDQLTDLIAGHEALRAEYERVARP